MALIVKDRVKETTSTTGAGTLTLAGAEDGFQSFNVIGNSNTTYYSLIDESGNDAWEVGIGTYTASGTTLARTTILSSSNSGNAINLGSGAHKVFTTYPAAKASFTDAGIELPYNVSGDTVAAGVGVGLNSNGTVSKIKETTSYNIAQQAAVTGLNSSARILGSYFKEDDNTIVIFFRDENTYPSAIAGTVNTANGVVTWGSKTVCSSNTCYTNNGYQAMTTGTYNSNFSYFYAYNRDSYYTRIWCGRFTVSGTSITMMSGSEFQISSFGNQTSNRVVMVSYDQSAGYLVAMYQTYSSSGQDYYNTGWCQPTSSSFQRSGGAYEYQNGNYKGNYQIWMWYDVSAGMTCSAYTSNGTSEVVIARLDGQGSSYGWQYPTEITSFSGISSIVSIAYNPGISRTVAITYHESSPYEKQIAMLQLSSSGSSWVTQTNNNTSLFPSAMTWYYQTFDRNQLAVFNGKMYQSFRDTTDSNKWKVLPITCSTGSGFSGTPYEINNKESDMVTASSNFVYYQLPNNYDFVCWRQTSSYDIENYSGKTETTTNINDFVGIAIDGNTSGNPTRVSLNGSINSALSSLTTNQSVFIANNGTIGTSGDREIGTALSATQVRLHAPEPGKLTLTAGENLSKGNAVGVGSAGTGFLAKNVISNNLFVGSAVEAVATSNLSEDDSGSNQGSAYLGNNQWAITYGNADNYQCVRVIQKSGSSFTLGTEYVLVSAAKVGADVDVGQTNDGTSVVAVVHSGKDSTPGQILFYTANDNNTLTLESSENISNSNLRNNGNNSAIVVKFMTNIARTVNNVNIKGAFCILGSYAGVQWYDNSYGRAFFYYFSAATGYTIGHSNTTVGSGGISVYWERQSAIQWAAETNGLPYLYLCTPKSIRTGYWGICRIYFASDTSFNPISVATYENASNENADYCGQSIFARKYTPSSGSPYTLLYVFARLGTNVKLQVFQEAITAGGSTTSGSQVQRVGSVGTIQTSLNSGSQPIETFYDSVADKAVLAYGNGTGTSFDINYGIFEPTNTSPYYSVPSNYTTKYSGWGRSGSYRVTMRFAHGAENNNTRALYNIYYQPSYGTGKQTLKDFGILRENYADNFIGIAQADATSTNPVTLKIIGTVDSNQSGLSTGQLVVLNKTTGELSTAQSVSSSEKEIGVSTGTNKFLIKG